jgi:pimeloyl-ACP methyl ester carboxylesterase
MKKFRFKSADLAGDVFYDQHREPVGSVLFLYGFPSFVGPNPLVQRAVSAGYAVISPHYYGTYDSDRDCSPASMVATVESVQRAHKQGEIRKIGAASAPTNIPPIDVVVGHSFGTAVVLRSVHYLQNVTDILLLSPTAHYGREPIDYGMRLNGRSHYASVSASHPNTYRLAPLIEWETVFDGADTPVRHNLSAQVRRVHIVLGEEDPYFDQKIAIDATPKLVMSYLGDVNVSSDLLPGVAHGMDELLADDAFDLAAWLAAR